MGNRTQALRNLWWTLGSTRLTTVLLASLLLASLLASLFPQMPIEVAAQQPWLAAARLRYGQATDLLHALGLFDAYHASWFLTILAALLLNTLVCTIQRLPRLWRSLRRAPLITQPTEFYQGFAHRAEWLNPTAEDSLPALKQTLSRCHYKTHLEWSKTEGCACLYAERGRWGQASTLVSHLAALLLVTAVLARPALGWQETAVALVPGLAYTPAREPDLTVQAGHLTVERHPDGQARNYAVPLTIEVGGSPAVNQIAGINHPLTFRGLAFHLQSYGPAVQVTTPNQTYNLAFTEGPAQEVALDEAGITLRITYQPEIIPESDLNGNRIFVEATTADGILLGSGTVPDGDEIAVQGVPITFRMSQYTTWQISHDPTWGPAIGAASLLLVALTVSLWVPYRRLWLRMEGTSLQMVGSGQFNGSFDEISEAIATACQLEVGTHGQ
ncbi:MAG TPA: cytochrome c biogenesis protein ResB [Anaerolineae bacterium]|nr:cytochrome c biogenesis protein ResB [Anaerolineae bacterium]